MLSQAVDERCGHARPPRAARIAISGMRASPGQQQSGEVGTRHEENEGRRRLRASGVVLSSSHTSLHGQALRERPIHHADRGLPFASRAAIRSMSDCACSIVTFVSQPSR